MKVMNGLGQSIDFIDGMRLVRRTGEDGLIAAYYIWYFVRPEVKDSSPWIYSDPSAGLSEMAVGT